MIKQISLLVVALFVIACFQTVADNQLSFSRAPRIEPDVEYIVSLPSSIDGVEFFYDISEFRVSFSIDDLIETVSQMSGGWSSKMMKRIEKYGNSQVPIDFRSLLYPMRRGEASTSQIGEMIVGYLIQIEAAAIIKKTTIHENVLRTATVIRKTKPFDRRLFLTDEGAEIIMIPGARYGSYDPE